MSISLSSIISSSISISVLIGILYLILKKMALMSRIGLKCIYLLVILILLRGFVPVEFTFIPLTKSFYSLKLFDIREFFVTPRFSIGAFSISFFTIFYFIWGIGFLYQMTVMVYDYGKCKRMLQRYEPITDPETCEIFQKAVSDIYPEKAPGFHLIASDIMSSPALFGIKHPFVILPDIPYTNDEMYYAFYHEIQHYRHKDFLIKLCVNIIAAIYWWNPIISGLLFKTVKQIQELLVDSYTTKDLDRNQTAAYMYALTKTLKYANGKTSNLTQALVDSHNESAIYNRLRYIISHPVKKNSISGTLLFILLFVASFTFVFEADSKPEKDEYGDKVWKVIEGETYFIRNGDSYDLYMQNEYVVTTDVIYEDFKDVPIYKGGRDNEDP